MATPQIDFRTSTFEEQPMAKDKLEEELAQAHSTRMTTECFWRTVAQENHTKEDRES
jgi:hypothetical protein